MDTFGEYKDEEEEKSGRYKRDRDRGRDSLMILRGLVIGFGLAAVASALFGLFQEGRSRRRDAMTPASRLRRQDEAGGVLGDLSHVVDESTSAFSDAVRALDRTFESGRRAIETVQDVINKIRE